MGEVERAVSGEAIALLGDRARDDPHGWITQLLPDASPVMRTEEAAVRADGAEARLGIKDGERVEAVLRLERVDGRGAPQRHCRNSPARILVQQAIDIVGLMRAMERAWTEMDDAGAQPVAIIGRLQSVTP